MRGLLRLRTRDFQEDVEKNTARWNNEWLDYWFRHRDYNYFYFRRLREAPEAVLNLPRAQLAQMSEAEFYEFKPFADYAFQSWTTGAQIIGATVVELGCGPGAFGRIVAPLCQRFIGIDYSPLALEVARLTSAENCDYIHLSEVDRIERVAGKADICVGRFFFIHQNWTNACWVLQLFHSLLKPGGLVSADFYTWFPDSPAEKKPTVIHRPGSPLDPRYPSCVFEYSEEDIHAVAAECGFTVRSVTPVAKMQRRFAVLEKNA